MGSLVLTGDTSGSVTVAVPAVAGTNTATLPAATGTVMVSGNMPAFSAYLSVSQTITTSVFTKVQCNTEEFDTNSNYDNATNYRFTPTVAGYYQVNGEISGLATVNSAMLCAIYKNGSAFKYGNFFVPATTAGRANVTALVYMNGSTDYIEMYGYVSGTGTVTFNASAIVDNYFQACLVRAA